MVEKVKVGLRGQLVIPKKLRDRFGIDRGVVLEIEETPDGLFLRPVDTVSSMKGSVKGVYKEPVEYQKELRDEWERKTP